MHLLPARLRPDSVFARVAWLLAIVLLAILAVSLASLRTLSLDPGSEQIADLLAGQIVALRVAGDRNPTAAGVAPRGDAVVDLRRAPTPPAQAQPATLPFLQRVESRLRERLGARTEMRVEVRPESRLWVRVAGETTWLGVAIPPFAQQATRLTGVILLAAMVLVLVAAALFARSLTRPIQRLAARAGALVRGEEADDELTAQAPREVRALEQELRDAGAAHRRRDADRALMLAGISHDLRTPLARLRYALALQRPEVDTRDGMQSDIDELDAIVQQFIDFARQDEHGERARVDLAALLRELAAHERLDPALWSLDGLDVPCVVNLQPAALRRAVANLLRNAVRHGAAPFGFALLRDAGAVTIVVRDAGSGVAEQALAAIAQPFVRGDAARGGTGGSGLGLAIAERVAHQHGGRLLLRNREAGGFEARLVLPGV